VRRDGYYGKRKQYVRWKCLPDNSDRPHLFRPGLSSKLVGGRDGDCEECERPWQATEGMPAGTRDRFTLREKAAALYALSRGDSYREAANYVRKRGGYGRRRRGVLLASRDGRITGDWVSQYASILAEHYLPASWPRALILDKLPLHARDTSSPTKRPSGRALFNIFAAASYVGDRALLWRLEVIRGRSERDWKHFLSALPGRPHWVVCDRDQAMIKAVEELWPGVRIYACVAHLRQNVEQILVDGKLFDRRRVLVKALDQSVFSKPEAYAAFRNIAGRYLAADLSRLNRRPRKTLGFATPAEKLAALIAGLEEAGAER
jgi:hypothetical protein